MMMTQTIYILKQIAQTFSQLTVDALNLLRQLPIIYYDPIIANPSLLQLATSEAPAAHFDSRFSREYNSCDCC